MDTVTKTHKGMLLCANLLMIGAFVFSFWMLGNYFFAGGEHPGNVVLHILHLPDRFSEPFPDSWFELVSLQTFINWFGAIAIAAVISTGAVWLRDRVENQAQP